MQILVDAKPADAKLLRDVAEDRLRFALRRLSRQVAVAKLSFSDVNGPRGGVDKRAQIHLNLQAHGTLVVVAIANNWRAALENALRLTVAKVLRTIKQAQRPRRDSMKALALTQSVG